MFLIIYTACLAAGATLVTLWCAGVFLGDVIARHTKRQSSVRNRHG